MRVGSGMNIVPTRFKGLNVADTREISDDRGAFKRCFCVDDLSAITGTRQIVQINHSMTRRIGTIRGLHFQHPPYCEMKMVRCLRGRVLDVAVDLRAGSATFLKHHKEELSAENNRMLVIPEGFAHGFQVLDPESELLYLHTAMYTPSADSGVRYDDPALNIEWPMPSRDVSEKDQNHTLLPTNYAGIEL